MLSNAELFFCIMSCSKRVIYENTSQTRLKDFADNDPAVMEQMVKETREALEATNRSKSDWEGKSILWLKMSLQVDGQHIFNPRVGEKEVSLS